MFLVSWVAAVKSNFCLSTDDEGMAGEYRDRFGHGRGRCRHRMSVYVADPLFSK